MKILEITSSTNAQFKIFKSLLTSKGIKENKLFILSGQKLVEEYMKAPVAGFTLEYVLFEDELKVSSSAKVTRLSNDLFKELDILGTHFNLLILSFHPFAVKDLNQNPVGLEVICPLGDPRNLGSLIRTAVGFGVNEFILTSEATHPYLPHCVKASAGAALFLKITLAQKKLVDIPMTGENFALELHGTDLARVQWPSHLRLWVGEEGPGLGLALEQKRLMKFVNIKTHNIESLNATVSSSLAIWEWSKQKAKFFSESGN